MKKTVLVAMSLFLVGCTTVKEKYHTAANHLGKFNHESDYLQSENYVASRVNVPEGLSKAKFEDKFTVPVVTSQSTNEKPSLNPPIDSGKG